MTSSGSSGTWGWAGIWGWFKQACFSADQTTSSPSSNNSHSSCCISPTPRSLSLGFGSPCRGSRRIELPCALLASSCPHIPCAAGTTLHSVYYYITTRTPTTRPPASLLQIMPKRRTMHRKDSRSASDDPWTVDTPFGPPRASSFPAGGIRRLRNTLHKLSPSAFAEKEELKKRNQYRIPLTERNVDTFVTEQRVFDACHPNEHTTELQISAWLDRLSA